MNPTKTKFSGETPRAHRLSSRWVFFIAVFLIIIILLVLLVQRHRNSTKNNGDIIQRKFQGKYFLVWEDNFSKNPHTLKKFPNIQKWILPQMEEGDYFFDNQLENAYLRQGKLFLEARPLKRTILDNSGQRFYSTSSVRLISRVAITHGFISIRAGIIKYPGTIFRISLLPYKNVAMNIVGSKHGSWPECGEIRILEISNSHSGAFSCIFFGNRKNIIQEPLYSDQDLLPLHHWDDISTYGLEWTKNKIIWHMNSEITRDGKLRCGSILQKISKKCWFGLNKYGKKYFPPAPFDQPYHLVISIMSSDGEASHFGNHLGSIFLDHVKIYQKPKFTQKRNSSEKFFQKD